jgi:hypothetical protein
MGKKLLRPARGTLLFRRIRTGTRRRHRREKRRLTEGTPLGQEEGGQRPTGVFAMQKHFLLNYQAIPTRATKVRILPIYATPWPPFLLCLPAGYSWCFYPSPLCLPCPGHLLHSPTISYLVLLPLPGSCRRFPIAPLFACSLSCSRFFGLSTPKFIAVHKLDT